nr:hypothetical protein [Brucella anthropi]
MATLSDYMSGTISLANGSVTVTGTGTLFEVTRFREGDTLQIQNLTAVIASVDSNTQLTLAEPWTGASIVNGAYRARQLGDGSRVSTQAATIIELLGNGVLMNLAELGVEEGKVPVGGPTGEYELTDLVQDPNGSLDEIAALERTPDRILGVDGDGKYELQEYKSPRFDIPQALDATQQGQARANIGVGLLAGFRNKIINGDFEVSARGGTFNSAGYTLDRWKVGYDGTGSGRVGTINQYVDETVAAAIGSTAPQHLNWTETTAGTGYVFKVIQQVIENVRTLAGRKATVTFWCVMPVGGPYSMLVTLRQVFGASGSPSAAVDSSASIILPGGNTWQKYSVAFDLPPITGKTLTSGNGLTLLFHLPTGIPFTFGLKRVSVVEGDATMEDDPFSPRHIQQEIALCQRYYEVLSFPLACSTEATSVTHRVHWLFKEQKRVAPTVTLAPGSSALAIATPTTQGVRANDTTGGVTAVNAGSIADAEF